MANEMNRALKVAVDEVARMPDDVQEHIAAVIREELADEDRWDRAFSESQDALKRLAEGAVDEYKAGRTDPLDRGDPKLRPCLGP